MLTTMGTYRPRDLNIYIEFDAESDCLVPGTPFLSLGQIV